MNILFINNWNLNNGLTISTTFPSLEVLSKSEKINKIVLVTPEYDNSNLIDVNINKVIHYPIDLSSCIFNRYLKYICYETKQKNELLKLGSKYKIDKIIARGAQAGGRAWWLSKKLKKPFYVESFEPHSEYMVESGVWSKYDPRYLIQKYWEKGIMDNAAGIMPVSKNYENFLEEKGVLKDRLATVPCTVDLDQFKYSEKDRNEIRSELNINKNSLVGIYVGKFGDIYYDDEAFHSFDTAFQKIEDFHLILLSPQKEDFIKTKLKNYKNIVLERVDVKFVSHDTVPKYLSASDFAYEFHKAKPHTLYCSPIKVGEYWANGLALIISKGVGDDAKLIETHNAGSIFEPSKSNYSQNIEEIIQSILQFDRNYFMSLASKYRNRKLIKKAYEKLELI